MSKRKRLRDFIGIVKDKSSLIKANTSLHRPTASLNAAVLRATTHSSSFPPDHRLSAVLSLGAGCIEAITRRLRRTRNSHVALKCLVVLHVIATRGSLPLRDHLAGRNLNFLDLSRFHEDRKSAENWELSDWVRWYGVVLERNLITSRVLGFDFSSPNLRKVKIDQISDLLNQIDALGIMVEEITKFPNSLHFQKKDIVYQLVRLVGEDYRLTQYQIYVRVMEFGHRIGGMNSTELGQLMGCLERLEDCRERLVELFVNRYRNDEFWELIVQAKMKIWEVKEERERGRLLRWREEEEESGSTRFEDIRPGRLLRLGYGNEWLRADRVQLTVSAALV